MNQREIKFRAWDRKREEILPVTKINFNSWWVSCEPVMEGSVPPLEYGERNSFKNEETDRHILMQYMGLKDKDGVEIYEGDWCSARFRTKEGIQVIQGQIIMDEFMWSIECPENCGNEIFSINRLHHFTIIGNVHQNPELLNKQ